MRRYRGDKHDGNNDRGEKNTTVICADIATTNTTVVCADAGPAILRRKNMTVMCADIEATNTSVFRADARVSRDKHDCHMCIRGDIAPHSH